MRSGFLNWRHFTGAGWLGIVSEITADLAWPCETMKEQMQQAQEQDLFSGRSGPRSCTEIDQQLAHEPGVMMAAP